MELAAGLRLIQGKLKQSHGTVTLTTICIKCSHTSNSGTISYTDFLFCESSPCVYANNSNESIAGRPKAAIMVSSLQRLPAAQDLRQAYAGQHGPSKRTSAPASTIERLMHESANGQDVTSQLTELKRQILLDGIDADETGMVRMPLL